MTNIKRILLAALLASASLSPLCAYAADDDNLDIKIDAESQDLLSLSVGYYDVYDNQDAADFRAEYRWGEAFFWDLKPWAGLEATSDGALYGVGGILADLNVADKFLITPSIGVGLYSDGGGKDLGHTIQFRSQLELGYELENGSRVGLAGSHISNCHLDENNQGTEILSLYYHIPVQWFD